jgi:hypothetical protein
MIIRSKGSFPGVVVGLDPDAITLIAAMTTAPDAARQTLISDHIIALKAAGIWSQLDTYYMMAAHHEQASRLNWKSPGNFTLVANGGITFTVDRGWQGDGSTGYLDTGWIPATHGVNYQLNDASFGVYSRTNLQQDSSDMGATAGSVTLASIIFARGLTGGAAGRLVTRINHNTQDAPAIAAVPNSTGLSVARRTNSSDHQAFKNGAEVAAATRASGLTTLEFYICARNGDGTPVAFSTRQYASAFTAAAMSEAQHAALYAAQQNGYLAAVGAAV